MCWSGPLGFNPGFHLSIHLTLLLPFENTHVCMAWAPKFHRVYRSVSLTDGGKTSEQLGLCIAPGLLFWDGLSSCFRQHTLYFRSNTEGSEAGEPNRWSLIDTLNILHSSKGSLTLHACIPRRCCPCIVHTVCSSTSLCVFIYFWNIYDMLRTRYVAGP